MSDLKTVTAFRCGKCFKEYSVYDMLALSKEQSVEGNPEYGVVPVCTCGYRFHKDKWRLRTKLHIPHKRTVKWPWPLSYFDKHTIVVSTVDLEMNHQLGGEPPIYYESMVHSKLIGYCEERRYTEQEAAIKDHHERVRLIRTGQYLLFKQIESDSKERYYFRFNLSEERA